MGLRDLINKAFKEADFHTAEKLTEAEMVRSHGEIAKLAAHSAAKLSFHAKMAVGSFPMSAGIRPLPAAPHSAFKAGVTMSSSLVALPIGQLAATVRAQVAMNEPLVVLGPPGVGKTQIIKQVAEAEGWIYCEMLLAGRDIGDVFMPFVANGEKPHLQFHYNPALPVQGSHYEGMDKLILLNIDEFSGANRLMQNVLLKVLDERKIGEARLLPNVRIVATGNRSFDLAHVEQLSAALANRASIITVTPDKQAFLNYGTKQGFHPVLLAWVQFDDEHLFSFNREQFLGGDPAFCSPRSNERISKLLQHEEEHEMDPAVFQSLVAGSIGQAKGVKFVGFRRMQEKMPNLMEICNVGTGIIPNEPPVLYATIYALVQRANPTNVGNILNYVSQLKAEWQEQVANLLPKAKPEIIETAAWGAFMAGVANSRAELSEKAKAARRVRNPDDIDPLF